ncbi:hypothetical protein CEP52_013680 [Fusarium oligoseptatum]|uniref:Major facilitator superfamily (MFS) profile domain-containing protein n=1 Tax=Fusarium oligoseptatum TaxID=2604345 RepID=A0A428SSC8_9HYPO|nr:hypothetical protein CEP52_013680 [Fusarium oligoseptatum]
MVLKWFKRPSLWIAIMTTTWGIVLLCTGFVQNYAGLLVCRVLLGVTEAGFFPGAILIVTNWYSWSEVDVRVALFYTSSALAGAFSGLLAYLIAKMDGVGGYEGWRWIFLLEGGVSTIIGLICPLIIIDTPALSKWLTEDEKRYLILHKEVEDGGRKVQTKGHKITGKVLFATLTDWKIYLQAIIALSNTIPNYGFKFTMPQIMKNMGYTSANAQLLTIPPYVLGAISAYVSARFADRYRWRMPFIVGPQFLVLIGFAITCAYSQDIKNRIGENYFAVSLACIGLYPIIPGANAWNSNNLAGPAKRAAGIGLLGTFASAGGLGGSFIYIETESPKYPTGFARAAWIDEKIEIELATMRYVAAKTTIPVPHVHAYSFTEGSPIQTAFIMMDYVQGKTLKDFGFKKGKKWRGSYSGPSVTTRFDLCGGRNALYARHHFRRFVLDTWLDSSADKGPFILMHGDMLILMSNLLFDDDLTLVGVLDWEWSFVIPAQMLVPPVWLSGGDTRWMLTGANLFYKEVRGLVAAVRDRERALQARPRLSQECAKLEKWCHTAVVVALLSPDLTYDAYWDLVFYEAEEPKPEDPDFDFREFYMKAIHPRLTAFMEAPERKSLARTQGGGAEALF